ADERWRGDLGAASGFAIDVVDVVEAQGHQVGGAFSGEIDGGWRSGDGSGEAASGSECREEQAGGGGKKTFGDGAHFSQLLVQIQVVKSLVASAATAVPATSSPHRAL